MWLVRVSKLKLCLSGLLSHYFVAEFYTSQTGLLLEVLMNQAISHLWVFAHANHSPPSAFPCCNLTNSYSPSGINWIFFPQQDFLPFLLNLVLCPFHTSMSLPTLPHHIRDNSNNIAL